VTTNSDVCGRKEPWLIFSHPFDILPDSQEKATKILLCKNDFSNRVLPNHTLLLEGLFNLLEMQEVKKKRRPFFWPNSNKKNKRISTY
jgi:hypothetical protein